MKTIRYTEKEHGIIVSLHGSINMTNVKEMEDTLTEVINKNSQLIAINFGELYFIDSSAIASLVRTLREALSKKINLVFFDLTPEIEVTFRLLKLYSFFTILTKEQFSKEYGHLLG